MPFPPSSKAPLCRKSASVRLDTGNAAEVPTCNVTSVGIFFSSTTSATDVSIPAGSSPAHPRMSKASANIAATPPAIIIQSRRDLLRPADAFFDASTLANSASTSGAGQCCRSNTFSKHAMSRHACFISSSCSKAACSAADMCASRSIASIALPNLESDSVF